MFRAVLGLWVEYRHILERGGGKQEREEGGGRAGGWGGEKRKREVAREGGGRTGRNGAHWNDRLNQMPSARANLICFLTKLKGHCRAMRPGEASQKRSRHGLLSERGHFPKFVGVGILQTGEVSGDSSKQLLPAPPTGLRYRDVLHK